MDWVLGKPNAISCIYIFYIYIYMYINDVVDVMLTPLIHTYVYAENTYFPIFSYIYIHKV